MRLKEIERILQNVDFKEVRISIEDGHLAKPDLTNISAFKEFIEIIEHIEVYEEEIKYLKNSSIYKTTHNKLELTKKEAHQILSTSNYLINSTQSLIKVFKKLLPDSNEQSISIKLPEPADFEALNKTMSIFQKTISQVVVNDEINGVTKVNNWEFGSFWIEIILGAQAAVALISSIAWSAAVISKKFNENKVLEQTVRSMEIKNDSLTDILESQKKMTSQFVENEAQSILDSHFSKKEPEQFERLKSAIKTFAKLIQEGAEIHPSLVAPEKVQNLFPNYKKLDTITTKIKQIEDKSTEDEGSNV